MSCGSDNFAGEKIFEYFHDFDDLRLSQKKNKNILLDLSEKPSGIQGPWTRQLNNALVNTKI